MAEASGGGKTAWDKAAQRQSLPPDIERATEGQQERVLPVLAFAAFEDRLASEAPVASRVTRGFIEGSVRLAYELHHPAGVVRDLLVFYHGGGVNLRAGYDRLAAAIAASSPIAVCVTDVRGHGGSGGKRGHAPKPEAVWQDVDRLVAQLASDLPDVRIHLGGHSTGAGLLLNALANGLPKRVIASLVLLAPNFGFHANLERGDAQFDGAEFWPFVVNWFSGGRLAGNVPAVTLDFSRSRMAREIGCVSRYTVNMALAVTPTDPGGKLARLNLPIWAGLAGDDEVIDAAKSEAFLARHAPRATVERLDGSSHLGAILDAAPAINAAMGRLVPPAGASPQPAQNILQTGLT